MPTSSTSSASTRSVPHRLVEIEHFFQTYKALEDKTVEMIGWREHDRAQEVLRMDREAWERETGRTIA